MPKICWESFSIFIILTISSSTAEQNIFNSGIKNRGKYVWSIFNLFLFLVVYCQQYFKGKMVRLRYLFWYFVGFPSKQGGIMGPLAHATQIGIFDIHDSPHSKFERSRTSLQGIWRTRSWRNTSRSIYWLEKLTFIFPIFFNITGYLNFSTILNALSKSYFWFCQFPFVLTVLWKITRVYN